MITNPLENYYAVELIFALRRYIVYCDDKGMICTAAEMRKLLAELERSEIYLKPFNN